MPEQETLVARVLCEITDVDDKKVYVLIRGKDDWIAALSFDLEFCPEIARIPGGSFYAETYRKASGEEELRSAPVDAEEDRAALEKLLGPLEEDATDRNSS
jgi:hypothetical protein